MQREQNPNSAPEEDRIENIFKSVKNEISKLLNHKAFKEHSVKGTDLKSIDKLLGQMLANLDTIDAISHREQAQKMGENIFNAKREIQWGRFESAKKILEKI